MDLDAMGNPRSPDSLLLSRWKNRRLSVARSATETDRAFYVPPVLLEFRVFISSLGEFEMPLFVKNENVIPIPALSQAGPIWAAKMLAGEKTHPRMGRFCSIVERFTGK
jgi:hypothetical protein